MSSGKDLVVSCCLLFLLGVHSSTILASDITCAKQLSPCSCNTTDGKIVDLKPLTASSSAPAFTATGADGWTYQWDPCREFTCGASSACGCQAGGSAGYPVGIINTAQFIKDGNSIALQYSDGTATGGRNSLVHLICDPSASEPKYEANGETPPSSYHYEMTLTSRQVCPNAAGGGSGGGGGGGGLSLGDVLLIIFFVSLLLYVVIGVLFNIFYRHNSGTDIIPNRSFWMSFPFLVKDGAVFVFSKTRDAVNKHRDYQKV